MHRIYNIFCILVVIKLEGGNDQDLRALDVATSSSSTNVDNDDGEDDLVKPSSNANELTRSDKADTSTSTLATSSKKASENKV